jgi:putative oxidoreductase
MCLPSRSLSAASFWFWAAAMIAINMLVALFTVGIHQGFGIYNYILALAVIAIMLVFYGAGAFALDRKIGLS